ncbi:MAG: hypothetical protein AB1758_37380, partial [Candidatus Eremiobacterota bacterium]
MLTDSRRLPRPLPVAAVDGTGLGPGYNPVSGPRAVAALEAHRRDLLVQNRPDEAELVRQDLALIRKAPGADLYEMSRLAQDRAHRLGNSILAKDAR